MDVQALEGELVEVPDALLDHGELDLVLPEPLAEVQQCWRLRPIRRGRTTVN
ncbi:hypothetical protein AB0M79_28965 [Polymorphospora sp. NPDC051019]|uniref:hypothetical protein n=1 Tax=Polymorphospora sp. NPDC051019 TaxID=3155725 RepID=UPI0034460FBC